MKKLILIFAMVAMYGISVSNASVTNKEDKKKETKKEVTTTTKTTGCCSGKTATAEKTATTGCAEVQKKSCAASGTACGSEAKK